MDSKYLEGMFNELPVRKNGNIMYSNINSSKILSIGKLEFRNVEVSGKSVLESQFLDYKFLIEKHSDSQLKGQEKVFSYRIQVEYKEHYLHQYIMSGMALDVASCPRTYMKSIISGMMACVSGQHIKNIVEE